MKLIAFNGSPRLKGNTHLLLQHLFENLKAEGVECEEINITRNNIQGCKSCGWCFKNKLNKCVQEDGLNEWIEKCNNSDAIILASPTYFANITTEMKAFIDRVGYVNRANGSPLKRKVGAPVVLARRGGAIQTFNTIIAFFGIAEMIVPMASYWNMGYGRAIGDVENDEEAIGTMKSLAENIAYVLKLQNK